MPDERSDDTEGGESACFAHLICPECGVVLGDTTHVDGCTWVAAEITFELSDDANPASDD